MRKILSILMMGLLVGLLVSCGRGDEVDLDKVSQDYLPIVDNLNALLGQVIHVRSSGLENKYQELKPYSDLAIDSYEKASSYLTEAFNTTGISYKLYQTKIRLLVNRHKAEVDNVLYCMKKIEELLTNIKF